MARTVLSIAPSLAEPGKRLVDAGELLTLFQFIFDQLHKLGSTDVVPSTTNGVAMAAEAPPPPEPEPEPEPPPPTRPTTNATTARRR